MALWEGAALKRQTETVDIPQLRGGGRMGVQIREAHWEDTPLGRIETWEPALVGALNLLLGSRFPMFLTWGDDNHLFYNDAYEPVLIGKGACLGRPIQSVFAEAWTELSPLHQAALAGEPKYFEDFPVPLARNAVLSESWWSFSYSPVTRPDGSVGGVLGVVYETTRRFLAERALRTSESALLAVTDMAPSMLWRCAPSGQIIWANQQLLSYIGADTLDGLRWDSAVHPEDAEASRRLHAICPVHGRAVDSQKRIQGADGQFRWFMVRSQQVLHADGSLAGWCGSATDIDEWRAAIDGLGDRGDLFRDFSSSDATLMWVADVKTREVEALNPQTRAAWALPIDGTPVPWTDWVQTIHPDDRPQMLTLFDRVAAGEVTQVKFRRPAVDGTLRRFHATGFPMPGPDGAVRRIGGMLVDVTRNQDQRIYLIDSDPGRQNALAHALTRQGVRVRTFDDAAAFERVSGDLLAGCVILAERGDFQHTLRTAGVLSLARDRLPWIVIGDFETRLDEVIRLMKLGASDVLMESRGAPEVAAAASSALSIHKTSTASRAPTDARQKIAQLSRREREVLDGLAAGLTNKAIAQKLLLSPRTVETHRAHLMDRLGVSSLAEMLKLVAEAALDGVVKKV